MLNQRSIMAVWFDKGELYICNYSIVHAVVLVALALQEEKLSVKTNRCRAALQRTVASEKHPHAVPTNAAASPAWNVPTQRQNPRLGGRWMKGPTNVQP
jgi:hypothetical protein